jgi:5'-nucleotidase
VGGVARRATVIDQEREKGNTVLVLDAGDSLVGDREPAKSTQGATSVTTMNMMGYDALALGPQDLALGLEALRQRMGDAEFAMLSANAVVSSTGALIAAPYALHRLDGHTIAIVGLSGESGAQEIAVNDPLETARTVVADIAAQADIIIILSHAGPPVDQQIAELVPSIDLIISGGKPAPSSPWWSEITGTLLLHADVASPGHAGRLMGIAHLAFDDDGNLVGQDWQRLSLGPAIPDDQEMANWVQQNR